MIHSRWGENLENRSKYTGHVWYRFYHFRAQGIVLDRLECHQINILATA